MTDSKIFIDTAPFIYLLEDNEQFSTAVRSRFSEYYMAEAQLCTSLITFTEYCVIPYRQGNTQKIADFENFIADTGISVIPLTVSIAKYASLLRSKYQGIKAMDALQLAFAIQNECDAFLTNDKQLRQIREIKAVIVSEL